MRKRKTYEVVVKASGAWCGKVAATSRADAQRIAESQFHAGALRPCRNEIADVVAFVSRTRTGSWSTFERRFNPIDGPDGATYWHYEQLPKPIDATRVWTILDSDGRLYISPGFRFVNRIDYVYCVVPWRDEDLRQPDYRYD